MALLPPSICGALRLSSTFPRLYYKAAAANTGRVELLLIYLFNMAGMKCELVKNYILLLLGQSRKKSPLTFPSSERQPTASFSLHCVILSYKRNRQDAAVGDSRKTSPAGGFLLPLREDRVRTHTQKLLLLVSKARRFFFFLLVPYYFVCRVLKPSWTVEGLEEVNCSE